MNLAFSAIVAPTGSTEGTPVDVSTYGIPKTINYEGESGDRYQFLISTDNGVTYTCPDGFDRTAPSNGDFSITSDLWFTHVRMLKKGGVGGGTCGITAPPLSVSVPAVALNVRNDTTPGTWADLRAVGPGRTLAIKAAPGNKFLIEGSDDGSTHPFPIKTFTVQSTKAGVVYEIPDLCNYARVTHLSGDSATGGGIAGAPLGSSATLNVLTVAARAVANTASSGFMGGLSAAASVDAYSGFVVTQTTASVDLTMQNPTDALAYRVVFVSSAVAFGAVPFSMYGTTIAPGEVQAFVWNGSRWGSSAAAIVGGNMAAGGMQIGCLDGAISLLGAGTVFITDSGTQTTIGRTAGGARTTIQAGAGVTINPGTVGVGIGGSADASAILDVQSTTQGLGLPSMTTVQRDAIASPRNGLVIYNSTTGSINIRQGGAWRQVQIVLNSGETTWVSGQSTITVPDAGATTASKYNFAIYYASTGAPVGSITIERGTDQFILHGSQALFEGKIAWERYS